MNTTSFHVARRYAPPRQSWWIYVRAQKDQQSAQLQWPGRDAVSVSVKWLAVKTASEMTYIVSSGALNSTPTIQPTWCRVPI